jgi:hypothetical protein
MLPLETTLTGTTGISKKLLLLTKLGGLFWAKNSHTKPLLDTGRLT